LFFEREGKNTEIIQEPENQKIITFKI